MTYKNLDRKREADRNNASKYRAARVVKFGTSETRDKETMRFKSQEYRARKRLELGEEEVKRRQREASRIRRTVRRDVHNAYKRQYSRTELPRLKLDVMNALDGGRCRCCGESNIDFLTVDHIHGLESSDIRSWGRLGGQSLYRKVRAEGYPREKYQVMCFNCNSGKKIRGACPHVYEYASILMLEAS